MPVSDAVFLTTAVTLLGLSWRSLRHPRSHGFYRLFGFLAIAAMGWLSFPAWGQPLERPWGVASSVLMLLSLYLVLHGLYLLVRRGGRRVREDQPANFAFENTQRLIQEGPYRWIRHPMYAALLLFAWGMFWKQPDGWGLAAALVATLAALATAKAEEAENLQTFGEAYRAYMARSWRFIPGLF